MKKTNFERYLEGQLKDPAFAARFERAGEAWDVALQVAALRQQAGLSQKDLAKLLKTSQQQISRLESPGYEGHSLSMLRRVARVLHARLRIVFEPAGTGNGMHIAEMTLGIQGNAPTGMTVVNGYSIRLAGLEPHPSAGSGDVSKSDYVASIIVDRVSAG
ncbi:MAG: helix-turn-helix transcriptional regulator [Deltaproteobacteria bacterium]|nr:helix-turn-helix transcriptional regulator [Deltaproteobacteria bacterium]